VSGIGDKTYEAIKNKIDIWSCFMDNFWVVDQSFV
jgi:hypothetical protein